MRMLTCFLQDAIASVDAQQQPLHRAAVLQQVFDGSRVPATLLKKLDQCSQQDQQQPSINRPPWRSVKGPEPSRAPSPCISHLAVPAGRLLVSPTPAAEAATDPERSTCSPALLAASLGTAAFVKDEDQPQILHQLDDGKQHLGVTVDKCAGLPQSASVQQLVGVRHSSCGV